MSWSKVHVRVVCSDFSTKLTVLPPKPPRQRASLLSCDCSWKRPRYTLFLDEGLVKRYPWRILVTIDTIRPAYRKRRLGWAWRVVCYKWSLKKQGVLGLGSPYYQQSRGRWYAWVWILPRPRTLQRVTTLSVSVSAVPNNGIVRNQFICLHSRCFWSYFDVIFPMYLVSSGFSFKSIPSSSIILIDPL